MENKETHDVVMSAMSPSYCKVCNMSGAELTWNPCPKQNSNEDNGIGLQEES